MIELVVFDIAGTTVNDPDLVSISLQEALADAGINRSMADILPFMGIRKPVAIAHLLREESSSKSVDEIHNDFVSRMIAIYKSHPEVKPIDGIPELLAELKSRGIKVALDTGFDRQICQVILDRLEWNSLFDATVTSDEVAQGRPAPDMVYRAMELTGVTDVARVVKVGDTPSDLMEGKNANCALSVGVLYGTHRRDQLERIPHSALIEHPSELIGLLETASSV